MNTYGVSEININTDLFMDGQTHDMEAYEYTGSGTYTVNGNDGIINMVVSESAVLRGTDEMGNEPDDPASVEREQLVNSKVGENMEFILDKIGEESGEQSVDDRMIILACGGISYLTGMEHTGVTLSGEITKRDSQVSSDVSIITTGELFSIINAVLTAPATAAIRKYKSQKKKKRRKSKRRKSKKRKSKKRKKKRKSKRKSKE